MAAGRLATFPAGSTFPLGGADKVPFDRVLYDSLTDSLALMHYVLISPTLCQDGILKPGALRARLPAWKRGQIINSAAFVREMCVRGGWSIPRVAINIARQIMKAEAAFQEELEAASLAGVPWRGTFDEQYEKCVRCGDRASWRFILKPSADMPPETSWRLSRPENAVPICRRCVQVTFFERREDIRFDLAWGLWSFRFEALHRWFLAVQRGGLPEVWPKEEYPLWPEGFGGPDWQRGSGSFQFCDPRPPRGVHRLSSHYAALSRAMGVAAKRHEKIGPYFSMLRLKQVNLDPTLEAGEYYCERGCIHRGTDACDCCPRSRVSSPGPVLQTE